MSDAKEWLLIKRDLYWRPNSMGYTGIRDHAGLYTIDEARDRVGDGLSGVSMIHINEAPEFRKAAFDDLVIAHLIEQRDSLRSELALLRAAA